MLTVHEVALSIRLAAHQITEKAFPIAVVSNEATLNNDILDCGSHGDDRKHVKKGGASVEAGRLSSQTI